MGKLKKGLMTVLSALICVMCAFGSMPARNEIITAAAAEAAVEKVPYKQLGAFLPGEASGTNGTFVNHPNQIYDNSGMNGDDGITHKHDNNAGKMWLSRTDAQISALAPVITLDRPNQLGLMFVWNYNETGKTSNGLKNITVSYSEDNQNWTNLGNYTLAKSNGTAQIKATNQNGSGAPIDFGGVYAKYVRIAPAATEGNWGGNAYGLSEVKIYEYKVEAQPGAYIKASPFGASANSFFRAVESQSMLTDGSGLSLPKSSRAKHDNNPAHMWEGTGTSMIFNLYGNYPLSDLYIWNYNAPDNLEYGIRDITVDYSSDPTGAWTKLGDFTVARAIGSNSEAASSRIPFNNKKAQLIRITIKNNYGGEKNGLSAVRFYCGTGDYNEPAHEWSSIHSTYEGAYGADGIFSASMSGTNYQISLDQRSADDKTWFVFSDTDVLPISRTIDEVNRIASGFEMPNNTYAVFTGNDAFDGEMVQYFKRGSNNPEYHITPTDKSNGARWWLGDTIIRNNKVYLTPHRVENYSGGMGFQHTGGTVISFGINQTTGITDFTAGYTEYANDKNPYMTYFNNNTDILMNAGFFSNTTGAGAPNPDGYIYNYGNYNQSGRFLAVSRVPEAQFEDLSAYRYYNGTDWVTGIENCAKGPANVSPELSVTPITFGEYAGKYMLLYQHNTQSAQTAVRFADNPWGPWSEAQMIHYTVEPFYMRQIYDENTPGMEGNPYCYNAKAHPALSKAGELIFSYNMNYMGGNGHDGHLKNIDNYHPRFLRYTNTGTTTSSDNNGTDIPVINVKITSVTLNKTTLSLPIDNTETLTAVILPENADYKVLAWMSSKPSVASVDSDGKITAKTSGSATITAMAQDGSGKSATCSLTVIDKLPVSAITLNKTALSISVGQSETLSVTITPNDASDKEIRWRTSDVAVATVDSTGKVTGKSVGNVTIKAEAVDGSGVYAECVVFVTETAADTGGGCGSSLNFGFAAILGSLGALWLVLRRRI